MPISAIASSSPDTAEQRVVALEAEHEHADGGADRHEVQGHREQREQRRAERRQQDEERHRARARGRAGRSDRSSPGRSRRARPPGPPITVVARIARAVRSASRWSAGRSDGALLGERAAVRDDDDPRRVAAGGGVRREGDVRLCLRLGALDRREHEVARNPRRGSGRSRCASARPAGCRSSTARARRSRASVFSARPIELLPEVARPSWRASAFAPSFPFGPLSSVARPPLSAPVLALSWSTPVGDRRRARRGLPDAVVELAAAACELHERVGEPGDAARELLAGGRVRARGRSCSWRGSSSAGRAASARAGGRPSRAARWDCPRPSGR